MSYNEVGLPHPHDFLVPVPPFLHLYPRFDVAILATCSAIVMLTRSCCVVASAEDWEFDDHSESDSQGRRTPVPG